MTLKIKEGDRFGRLTVTKKLGKDANNLYVYCCVCDCGEVVSIQGTYLSRGRKQSCGCLRAERLREVLTTHGMKDTPTYKTWEAMKSRCTNPNVPAYGRYGGAGVVICEDWLHSFENFYRDMGERPEGKTLNRIDGVPLYSKETCEWATVQKQARDQRVRCNTKTGVRGITLSKEGYYLVRITTDEKRLYLGAYQDFFEACCVRKAAELRYWQST